MIRETRTLEAKRPRGEADNFLKSDHDTNVESRQKFIPPLPLLPLNSALMTLPRLYPRCRL
jgi:hypothetical protein